MLGSLPVRGVSISPQQVDVLFTASHTPAATSTVPLDASPASPRLFGSTSLPQTPPSQLLRAVSSPPPVRRLRNIASPPPASHPILSSAIALACTIAPDATRLPRQRQLAFPIQHTPPAQHASPFAAAVTVPEPPSLLDKIDSLLGPQQLLRSVLTADKGSFSLHDSGMLTHMLHRGTLFPTESEGGVASSSAGSACSCVRAGHLLEAMQCSHPVTPEDAASPMRPKRRRPSALKAPAPPVSEFCVDAAGVDTLLGSSRSAFSKTALYSQAYISKSQGTAYGAPTPSTHAHGRPQDGSKGISVRSPQGRAVLQHAATMPRWPPADSMCRYASAGPDNTQPAQAYPGTCSATALTHFAPCTLHKGCLFSATARPGSSAKPFCSVSDFFDFQNQDGKVNAINQQAVKASQNSPRDHVSWDPTGFSDSTGHIPHPSVSRPGHFLKAPLTGAVPRVNSSSSSNYQAGRDLLTPPMDITSAHTCTTHSQKVRTPSVGSFNLAQAVDGGRAILSEPPGSRATNVGLPRWCPPQSTSDHGAAAGDFATHAGLEVRLTLPHGTRGHKRPRLEDKLMEATYKACILNADT